MMNNGQSRVLSVFGSIIIICGLISIYTTGIKGVNLFLGTLVVGITAWVVSFTLAKNKMNETSTFGELEPNQYRIYMGGEQEDKNKNREPMKYYYRYTEPIIRRW